MPNQPAAPSPIQPGAIVSAEIRRTSGDTCFLHLQGSDGARAEGRLKQADSLHWKDCLTLEKLPAYAVGQKLKVMVRHGKSADNHAVWFTQERWAYDNPWPALENGESLREGHRVTGFVARVARRSDDSLVGYIVQLDTAKPICDLLGEAWLKNLGESHNQPLLQPDLEVFLPAAELPSLDEREGHFLELAVGERVTALVLDARRKLPDDPLVSVRRLRDAVDAHFWSEPLADTDPAMKAAFDLALRRTAPLPEAKNPTQEAALPWDGRDIGLVDDQNSAAQALAATLRHRGAEVTLWTPEDEKKGWRETELQDCMRDALASGVEVLLVDDGMPQAHRGENALVAALKAAREDGHEALPRVWLMSGQTPDTTRSQVDLRAYGVRGSLRRPVAVAVMQTLLDKPDHETWEWQGETSPTLDLVSLSNPRALDDLLRFAQRALQQDYAVLLAVGPSGQLRWRASAGRVPFEPAKLDAVVSETDLGLLAKGRQRQLTLAHGGTLSLIHPQPGHVARWQALSSGKEPEYLLGAGSYQGLDCQSSWPWLVYAARAELQAQQLNALFQNNTSALSAGWLAEGYAHDTVHDRQDLLAVVEAMDALSGRAQAQGRGVDPSNLRELAAQMRRVVEAQNTKAQTLLRRHRQRSAPLNLRAWVGDMAPLLFKQCSEDGAALRLGDDTPDLVLPVPEWLLTLCVVNLVLNAVKHHGGNDAAWVRLDFELMEEAGGQQNLCIRVQDNGWGLSPDARSQLFSPSASEAPDPETRHGIGLWLSQTLVRQAGGELRLAWSYRGFGACFELAVPVTLG